jgi:hypothetical protein
MMNQTKRTNEEYDAAIAKFEAEERAFAELLKSYPDCKRYIKAWGMARVMDAYYQAKKEENQ